MSDALAAKIEARASELAARANDLMYIDPFWEARFGERGRKYTREDGLHHVNYLCEALRAGGPGTLTNYARWLRSVLVTRGMCTLHLVETFRRLGQALAESLGEEALPARVFLDAAAGALAYDEGAAGALEAGAERAADVVLRVLAEWGAGREGGVEAASEVRHQVSYVRDAVAAGRPELFAAHARWADGFYQGCGVDFTESMLLAALERGIAEACGPAAREAALPSLRAAREALGERGKWP